MLKKSQNRIKSSANRRLAEILKMNEELNTLRMNTVYIVKDGIVNVGYVRAMEGNQIKNTNFHLITYDFKTNEGYIELKGDNQWRLYTQIGQSFNQSRYHHFLSFKECLEKLKELKGDENIITCNNDDYKKYLKK